jgi:hypothetical protein
MSQKSDLQSDKTNKLVLQYLCLTVNSSEAMIWLKFLGWKYIAYEYILSLYMCFSVNHSNIITRVFFFFLVSASVTNFMLQIIQ